MGFRRHLKPQRDQAALAEIPAARKPLIGHGEIPAGTPQPYFEFTEGGNTLRVRTPFTPRPYDHTMSNALGHVLCGDQPWTAHLGQRERAAEPADDRTGPTR